jgi:hypothetical protein
MISNVDQKVNQKTYGVNFDRIFKGEYGCEDCGNGNAKMQSCPFDSEMNGNYTEVSLCDDCAHQRAMDI